MIKQKYIRDAIFLLLALYYAQGSLYAQGSILSQSVLVLVLLISSFYFVKIFSLKNIRSPFFNAWTGLFLMNIFGFIFTGDINNPYHISMFKGTVLTSLTFYPFYYFKKVNNLKPDNLIKFFIIMFPLVVLQYYFKENQILSGRNSDKQDVVNNTVYIFVALLPYIFLFKRKVFAFVFVLISMFFIIQGAKRGALVAGSVGLLGFAYLNLRTIERKDRFKNYLFILLGLTGTGYFLYDFYTSNEYLVSRISGMLEGNSSGRDVIFSNVFNSWFQSESYINLLFGFGYAASLELSGVGLYAHNDWLELLSNYGLLGVSLYAFLFITAFNELSKSSQRNSEAILLLVVLSIWLINTTVYRFYSAGEGFIYSILLGYLLGNRPIKLIYKGK